MLRRHLLSVIPGLAPACNALRAVVLVAAALTLAQAASAQGMDERAALEARQEALLSAMLADPQDLDTAFEHAAVSVRLDDYEAAVGTLERILVMAPESPAVLLELGVLYYRLGSFETARIYLQRAETAPGASPAKTTGIVRRTCCRGCIRFASPTMASRETARPSRSCSSSSA